jgi:hypothetical protein
MTEAAMMFLWNAGLTLFLGLISWAARNKEKEFDEVKKEQQRISILLNRTREEIAKEYVTKAEVHADIGRVIDRLERLDQKIDVFIKELQHAQR